MTRANLMVFKSKTAALIDTLHLTANEVVGLALSMAAEYGKHLNRHELHAMLDASVTEARGGADVQQAIRARMAEVARTAKGLGLDGMLVLRTAFPGAPGEVLASIWWEIEEQATAEWWDSTVKTIEANGGGGA